MTIHRCPNCGFVGRSGDYAGELLALPLSRGQRRVLTRLMIARGATVTKSQLIDDLYDEDEPETAENVLQTHISHLRKAIGSCGWTVEGRRFEGYRLLRKTETGE